MRLSQTRVCTLLLRRQSGTSRPSTRRRRRSGEEQVPDPRIGRHSSVVCERVRRRFCFPRRHCTDGASGRAESPGDLDRQAFRRDCHRLFNFGGGRGRGGSCFSLLACRSASGHDRVPPCQTSHQLFMTDLRIGNSGNEPAFCFRHPHTLSKICHRSDTFDSSCLIAHGFSADSTTRPSRCGVARTAARPVRSAQAEHNRSPGVTRRPCHAYGRGAARSFSDCTQGN